MEKKGKLIGMYFTNLKRVKAKYRFGQTKNYWIPNSMVSIEIRENKQYGAKAEMIFNATLTQMINRDVTKKVRKIARNSKKNADRIVDTSKWVRPDRKSIQNEIIISLFVLEVLKETERGWIENYGRAEALYSILESHSPKNPQRLINFGITPYFERIFYITKSPEKEVRMKISFPNYKNGSKENWFKEVRDGNEARKMYKKWKKKCLKEMIIKGSLVHHLDLKER